jgi:hypothetical protein
LETKKSKNNDNNNGKKDIEGINNDHRSQYTYDSSDAKEIMTGLGGGEEGSTFPDSDKHIVEDIKKSIKEEEDRLGEEGNAKIVQSNQIIKMKIIELFIFTTTKLLIKVH